jgi:acrylyl-CoA reductase (NADPH)
MKMEEHFKALVLRETEGKTVAAIEELGPGDLPEGDVLVEVRYSSLNYKDGLAVTGRGKVVRRFPMVPGIDLVGKVLESESSDYAPGDEVILTGWGVGEKHWGGYSQRQRLRSEWLVPLPEGLGPMEAMAVGTAGLTAMLCVMTIGDAGAATGDGPVLVTGASGGVGSVAVALLAGAGYQVAALTGRPDNEEYVRELGAVGTLSREEMEQPFRALESQRWAAAIDTVGSKILARVLAEMKYGAPVAACGLAGGADLPTTVMPFILRGVRLLGVDSVMCPRERRLVAWKRLASELPANALAKIGRTITLEEVPSAAADILSGRVRGRVVVDVNG